MSIYSNQNMTIGEAMDNDISVANTQLAALEIQIDDVEEIANDAFDTNLKNSYSRFLNSLRDIERQLTEHRDRLEGLRDETGS